MSILIKGMDMPENCEKCRFCVNGFTDSAPMYECAVQSYDNVSVTVDCSGKPFDFRPDWCPLVEVPTPHGRLIDADELVRIWKGAKFYGSIKPIVDARPTVIEAEDGTRWK